MNKMLKIAKSKIKHHDKRTYCGYLTSSEFFAIFNAGIRSKKEDILRMQTHKDKGESDPNWLYFQLGKLDLAQ